MFLMTLHEFEYQLIFLDTVTQQPSRAPCPPMWVKIRKKSKKLCDKYIICCVFDDGEYKLKLIFCSNTLPPPLSPPWTEIRKKFQKSCDMLYFWWQWVGKDSNELENQLIFQVQYLLASLEHTQWEPKLYVSHNNKSRARICWSFQNHLWKISSEWQSWKIE